MQSYAAMRTVWQNIKVQMFTALAAKQISSRWSSAKFSDLQSSPRTALGTKGLAGSAARLSDHVTQ